MSSTVEAEDFKLKRKLCIVFNDFFLNKDIYKSDFISYKHLQWPVSDRIKMSLSSNERTSRERIDKS